MQTQSEEQSQSNSVANRSEEQNPNNNVVSRSEEQSPNNNAANRSVDSFQNQDKVFKESLSLFKGGTLDFLDEELSGEVTEVLSTEITETTTKKAFADNALKLAGNKGIHSEWEAKISESDIQRFASYNIDLCRAHSIPFTSVIITTSKPTVASYQNPSLTFAPKIINLKDRDADKALEGIFEKLKAGEIDKINPLEVIYLPLYGSASGKATAELFDTALKLTPEVAKGDDGKRQKLQDLLVLLTSTFIDKEELDRVLEANMRIYEDNPAIKFFEERYTARGIAKGISQGITQGISEGRDQRDVEIALNMLHRGRSIREISEDTGLSEDRVMELQNELQTVA